MTLLFLLPHQDGHQHSQEVLLPRVHTCAQARAVEQLVEEGFSLVVAPQCKRPALAPLPAVTVGSGRGPFEAAVVATMTSVRTLRAAAERACQATGTTLKDVLMHKQE